MRFELEALFSEWTNAIEDSNGVVSAILYIEIQCEITIEKWRIDFATLNNFVHENYKVLKFAEDICHIRLIENLCLLQERCYVWP